MLISVLLTLHIISGLVAGEQAIRQTPEGDKTLDVLSDAGLFFLKWRAYSDYKKDLEGLRNIFGSTGLILGGLLYLAGPTDSNSLFNALPALFLVLWFSMQFGTNFKKSVGEQLSFAGLFVIGPWLILGMDFILGYQPSQLRLMASPFSSFGIQDLEIYHIAIFLSLIGGAVGLFMAMSTIVIFSIVPLFFLFLMASLSTFSKSALNIEPRVAKNIALLYCFVVGPILMTLESKGYL